MNLVILGAPGSGKGTQAKLLSEYFHLVHLSSGSLLRQEAASGSAKGKIIADLLSTGKLLPFETVLAVLEPAMKAAFQGFILDGTPRDVKQAQYLDWYLKENKLQIDKVIYLSLPREESLARLLKRAQTESRSDDTPQTINFRLDVFEKETFPVLDYYRRLGLVIEVDGRPDIQTIFNNLVTLLAVA